VLREALAAYLAQKDGPRVHENTPLAIGETSTIGDDDEPVIPASPM
jgi:hypothetical protein